MADGITDETLSVLADNLAVDENVPKLGIKLGIRKNQVDLYMRTNKKNDTSEGTSTMLFAWKKKTLKSQQVPKLVGALIDSDLVAFAEESFPAEVKRQLAETEGHMENPATTSAAKVDSSNTMDRIVSDKELRRLAGKLLAGSYMDIAVNLGLDYAVNDNIKKENQSSLKDANFQMLQKWKCKQNGGKVRDLDEALNEADCGGLSYKEKA